MFDIDSFSLVLAQDQHPAPGEREPAQETAPGTSAPGGARQPTPFGGSNIFVLVFLVIGAMLIFSILGQRRDRKKREAMISAVRKHDRVQTVGGVVGSIVEVKGDHVVLKVDESSNTRITFARSAIQQVLSAHDDVDPAAAGESLEST